MNTFVDDVKELAEKSPIKVKVFSYKDEADFACLWGLDNPSKDSITERLKCWAKEFDGKELTVVIVHDGMPQSTRDIISVGDFVGPYDWALAASWSIYKNPCLQNLKLRILILNVHPSGGSFSSRSLFAFQNTLPWIQDYRVVGSTKSEMVKAVVAIAEDLSWLRQALPPESRDMKMFVEDLLNPKRVLTTYPEGDLERSRDIELTKNLWSQNLLKAETRHSVANLVAPAILASGLPNAFSQKALDQISQGSLMRRALISTLREVGFLETNLPNSPTNQEGKLKRYCKARGDVFGRLKNIRFVLVDDHFDRGYHHILGYTLFGKGYLPEKVCLPKKAQPEDPSWTLMRRHHSLKCYKSLDWLIQTLDEEAPVCNWKQPRYLFDDTDAGCNVLFLDLRLWEDENEDENKESRSVEIQKVLCAAKRLLGCTPPTEVSSEFARAFEAAQKTCDDPDKFSPEALTLLPLLLSHVDRTLPIVLFTSSHQRVVLEMLQNCPNVITSFAKPLISGYGEPITPSHSISDLEEAIEKAINLHEARIAWKRISELDPQPRLFSNNTQTNEVREVLRARIGMLFERCLYTRGPFSPFEEIDKPWELLEELVVQTPSLSPILFRGVGRLTSALNENRNARTHGGLIKEEFDRDPDRTRQVLVLQLLFLLDFLGRDAARGDRDDWDDPQTLVCSSERGLGRVLCNLAESVHKPLQRQWLDESTELALTKLWETVAGTSLEKP